MFSWVTLLCDIVGRSLHSFTGGDTLTCLECGLQLQFKNTEYDGISVWLKQLKPLLMSATHVAKRTVA